MTEPGERPRSEGNDVWVGIGLALLVLPVIWVTSRIIAMFLGLIGLDLFLLGYLPLAVGVGYLIVVIRKMRMRGRPAVIKGIIIGASLMALLATACVGIILWIFSGH